MSVPFRIGQGYDVHAFMAGDHIMLGGVRIPHRYALRAHSDGDVLLHALADALLGAIAAGDIGQHFPDTDPDYAGADSLQLLQYVYQLVQQQGYHLLNADMTVLAQAPKLAPHIPTICQTIAAALQVDVGQISVKATTTEKLGFVGREEGIAASANVLLTTV